MPTVDFNALQAAGQPTAVTLRNDTSDAAAAVTSDFSQFDSVILEAVLETDFSGGAIQLVVEHSSDQVTWTTAATFTATGERTVFGPLAYWRARVATQVGLWSVRVTASPQMANKPAAGGTGTIVVVAKADVKSVGDAVMAASSAALTSATAAFTAADVGKLCSVSGAGATATTTATTSTSSNPTLLTSVSSTAGMSAGMPISGTGIPAGTTIVGIRAANSIVELSQAATASGTVTVSFSPGITGSIASYGSPTSVTLSVSAQTSVTGGTYGGGLTYGSDDSAAVTAAAAAAVSFGAGAKITLPSGSIYCQGLGATALVGISVVGAGPGSLGFGSVLIGKPGFAGDMVTLGKWGSVRDCGVEAGARGIVITDAYARIQNVEVGGQSGDGVVFTTAQSVGASLRDLHVNNCGGNGVNISFATAYDNDLVGVTIGQCGANGLRIASSDIACTNLHSWGNGTAGVAGDQNGVRFIAGVAGNRFVNCYFESNYGRGVYASSSGCKGHTFVGCWFWRNIQQGIYYFTGSFHSINGCAFWDQGASTSGGAAAIANDTGNSWVVQGNVFYDDQGTKTQTYAYQEIGTTSANTITGNNMQAANLKTASSLITSTTNIPVSASMGTLNNV